MKYINIIKYRYCLLFMIYLSLIGCENVVDTQVFSELVPEIILTSEDGVNRVLNSAYDNTQLGTGERRFYMFSADASAGICYVRGGGVESNIFEYESFTWDANHAWLPNFWSSFYSAIRDANIVLDNLDEENFTAEFINLKTAEAKFIRGYSYYQLYQHFGSTPLITSSTDELFRPRASDQEMRSFIETELNEAANTLPIDMEFGKATKGAALGVLAKFFLNTKQWDKSAEVTREIIDLNRYRLLDNIEDVFSLDNEGNDEILFAIPYLVEVAGGFRNVSLFYPPDYPLPYPTNVSFAASTFYFDDYINSFEDEDVRREQLFNTNGYVSTATGEFVTLLGNDKSLSEKYPWDPNSAGGAQGNDIPVIRFSDILLTRAEALNEINGPNSESIELINQVRERAGVSLLNASNFDQESLREQILQEREWEFWMEAKTREDQIRHGVFISRAQERGHNAQPFHILFPIPQVEIDANPEIEQNEGY